MTKHCPTSFACLVDDGWTDGSQELELLKAIREDESSEELSEFYHVFTDEEDDETANGITLDDEAITPIVVQHWLLAKHWNNKAQRARPHSLEEAVRFGCLRFEQMLKSK
eukprot:GHVU01117653.1.p1 GENE.GHVU01117653.1~~GHVU01117653.1.p1  ORF type:complete len:110 (-),score=20.02 GHVU01117653.1:286-615(-)